MAECVFRRIVAGTLPASTVSRDEDAVGFMDIAPIRPATQPARAELDRLAGAVRDGPA